MGSSDGGGSAGAVIGGILGGIGFIAVIMAGVLFGIFYERQRKKEYAISVNASSYIYENKHSYSGTICFISCVHVVCECFVWLSLTVQWRPGLLIP